MKGSNWGGFFATVPWGSKEISHVLFNPKTKCRVLRSGTLDPNLGQFNQVHSTYHTFFLFKIQFTILIPSSPTYNKLSIPFHRSVSIILNYYQKDPGVDTTVVNILIITHTHTHLTVQSHQKFSCISVLHFKIIYFFGMLLLILYTSPSEWHTVT